MLGDMRAITVWALCLPACAARETAPYAPEPSAVDRVLVEQSPPRAKQTSSPIDEAPRRFAGPRAAAPPRSARRLTLRLANAPLGEVVKLLAGESGLGIVLAEPLEQPVSLDVRHADPREVLDALAAAHGLDVERAGGLLIVRRHAR